MFSNKFFKHVTSIVLIISSLSLFACGGGDTTITIAPVLDPITINALNAKLLAKQGYSTLTQLSDQTSTLIQTAPSAASLSVVELAGVSSSNLKLAQADGIAQNCRVAGTRTSSDLTINPVIITFDACDDGTTTITGQLTLTAAIVVTPDFNATVEFTDLQITDNSDGITITLNGGATVTITTPNIGVSIFTFKGTLLSAKIGLDTVSFENFTVTRETNSDTNERTVTIDYSFSSSLIDGSLTVTTEDPFITRFDRLYPYQGRLVVTGAQGSKLRLTVNSGTGGAASDTVTIEVDPDGNGYDSLTQVVTWRDLFSL